MPENERQASTIINTTTAKNVTEEIRYSLGLKLLLLTLCLAYLQPAPNLVSIGASHQVQTSHSIVGVHTRLADEVEPWKIQRSLQMVREMGATTIVEFFPWAYYEPQPGNYQWGHPDLVVDHAQAQGITVIARIGFTPEWARPPDTSFNYLDKDGFEPFAAYTAAFAEHFRGRVTHIIIGNEPNLAFEWGYTQTTPADYVDLLKVVYPAVKKVNPDMIILAGALAPTLEPEGSPWGLNDVLYLDGMYAAGAAPYFDALAVHAYGFRFLPDSEPQQDLLNYRRVELLREVMVRHGDEATKMFITETGYNDHPRWTRAVSPAQRITYTLAALQFAEENWPYVDSVNIWAFRFPAPTKSYMDAFTIVTPEFIPKPIYNALQAYTGN